MFKKSDHILQMFLLKCFKDGYLLSATWQSWRNSSLWVILSLYQQMPFAIYAGVTSHKLNVYLSKTKIL